MQFRHVAPAGAPIRLRDLAKAAGLMLDGSDVTQQLRQSIAARFDVRHCFLTSTGRAGLTVLLKGLKRLAPAARDEVILPAYTCFSVAASVVKAGLRPRIVDIAVADLDYEPSRLRSADFSRVLAVIATNLYGLPNDLPAITQLARRRGAFVIDDAAQAMGATVGGRRCGTWGDAGLYSLDKGKNVSAIDGGLIVTTSDAIASAVEKELAELPSAGWIDCGSGVLKALIYTMFLRPWLYGIPNSIPQLGLGRTEFTTSFSLARPNRALVSLAVAVVGRLDELTRVRMSNAAALLEGLEGVYGIQPIMPRAHAVPVYLRLPLLFDDRHMRQRAVAALQRVGIGASGSYPVSLADVPQLKMHFPEPVTIAIGARQVAQRVMTLPTHAFVNRSDIRRTVDTLKDLLRSHPPSAAAAEMPVMSVPPIDRHEGKFTCAE